MLLDFVLFYFVSWNFIWRYRCFCLKLSEKSLLGCQEEEEVEKKKNLKKKKKKYIAQLNKSLE